MKLSALRTGETGVIVKVSGHGGFRKRIIEMGFIEGKQVEVLLNAPLRDPVKYKIMGYEVSLRHSEADQIEVVRLDDVQKGDSQDKKQNLNKATMADPHDKEDHALMPSEPSEEAKRRTKTINVALVGNPNCGKTSLFNFASGAHERVGN